MQGGFEHRWRAWLQRLSDLVLVALLAMAAVGTAFAQTGSAPAAEPRVALVIGNAAYADGALRNPVNDAREMSRTLRGMGFTVLAHENLGKRAMELAVLDFGRRLAEGGVGLIFYAGHGMQVRGRNYLVPVDARINDEAATRVAAVDIDLVLEQVASARNRVNVIILDACRNNPFERRLRGSSQGLAAIDAARGTLVAYATAPGSVAADGDGEHGLYTEELLRALRVPGLKIEEVFKRVRVAVAQRSKGTQTPWESSSLTGDLVINIQVQTAAPAPAATADRDALFWSSIKDSRDPAGYQAYLAQFPNGTFAELARQRIASASATATPATAAPAPVALPASAPEVRRFDGPWAASVVCTPLPPKVQGYTLELPVEVRNGMLTGQLGIEGLAGYLQINGPLRADGGATLSVRGITADRKFSVGNVAPGERYGYTVAARFDEQRGSGKRLELRPCDWTFNRR